MVTTFASWPKPMQGRVTYRATCPCGREAEWTHTGHATATGLDMRCDCRESDRER